MRLITINRLTALLFRHKILTLTSHCFSQSLKYSLMSYKMTKRNCPSFCLFPVHRKTTDAPNVSLMLEYMNRMIPTERGHTHNELLQNIEAYKRQSQNNCMPTLELRK